MKEAGSRGLGLRVHQGPPRRRSPTPLISSNEGWAAGARHVELAELAEPEPLGDLPRSEEMARAARAWPVGRRHPRDRRGRGHAARPRRRGGGVEVRQAGHQLGRGCLRARDGRVGVRDVRWFFGRQLGHQRVAVGPPLCDDADGKKRNGVYWTASRFASGLEDPERVGVEAARRTVAKLGSRKIATCQVPVVFSPDAGARACWASSRGVMSGGARVAAQHVPGRARRHGGGVGLVRHRRRSSAAARAWLAAAWTARLPVVPHERTGVGRRPAHVPVRRVSRRGSLGRRSTGSAARGAWAAGPT